MGKGIRAGQAYIEIGADNLELDKGLKEAQRLLNNFAGQVTMIGAKMVAIGSLIAAPFIASIKMFTSVGDQTAKTARSLGISTEALSNFGFAAERSGSSVDTFASSIQRMEKYIYDAQEGLKEAKDSMEALGLNTAELMQLSPDKQFMAIADALNRVQNPTEKAALAMRIFGRGVRELMPLLAEGSKGMEELFNQNKSLGGEIGTRTATAAEILDDAFTDLWQSVKGLALEIGEILAPYVKNLVNIITKVISSINQWISRHQNAIVIISATAVTVAALGVGLLAMGGAALVSAQGVALLNVALAILNAHPVVAVITLIAAGLIAIATAAGIASADLGKFNDEVNASIRKANELKAEQEALARQMDETKPEKQPKQLTDADIKRRRDEELDAIYSLQNERIRSLEDANQRDLALLDNRYQHELDQMRRNGSTQLAIDAKIYEYEAARDNLRAEFRKKKAEEENKIREDMARKREDELTRQLQIKENIDAQNEINLQDEARMQLQLQYKGLELKQKELELDERIAIARAEASGADIDTIKRIYNLRKKLAEIEDQSRNKNVEKALATASRGIFMATSSLSLKSPEMNETKRMADDMRETKNLTKEVVRNTRVIANNKLTLQ